MSRDQIDATKDKYHGERYKVWLKQGRYDLDAARLSYENNFNEWSTYQATQAVEKTLKSVLVKAGYRAPKVHKLPVLMGMCNRVNKEFKNTQFDYKHLESFTFISRYPFLIPGKSGAPHNLISADQAKVALEQSEDIYSKIARILQVTPETTEFKGIIDEQFTTDQVQKRLDQVVNIIVSKFNPEKIILFGSFARNGGTPKKGTMDILILAQTKLPFIERIKEARTATRGDIPAIEPLVYTPEEFKYMTEEEGEGFLEAAVEEGKVIYTKKEASGKA